MKLQNYSTQELEKALNTLQQIVEEKKKWDKSYFWTPPRAADYRRSIEKKESITKNYSVLSIDIRYERRVRLSARNYYVTQKIYADDKKVTLRFITGLIKKISKILEKLE